MCLTRSSQDLSSDYFHSGLQHTQTRGGQVQTWAEFYIQNLGFPFSSSFFLDYLLTICNPSSGTYSFKKKKKRQVFFKGVFTPPYLCHSISYFGSNFRLLSICLTHRWFRSQPEIWVEFLHNFEFPFFGFSFVDSLLIFYQLISEPFSCSIGQKDACLVFLLKFQPPSTTTMEISSLFYSLLNILSRDQGSQRFKMIEAKHLFQKNKHKILKFLFQPIQLVNQVVK